MPMRKRGFSLVELMVVVALMGVIASLAIFRMRKETLGNEVDDWANRLVQATNQARRRAISTKSTYMLDIHETTLQWCVVDPASVAADNTTSQTACPPSNAALERGPLERARPGATFVSYAAAVDDQGAAAAYAAPSKTSLAGSSVRFFFGANGTVSNTYATATLAGQVATGLTAYAEPTVGLSEYKKQKRRRVVVLGASARTRVINN